jgi:hypothetical protein
MDLKEALIKRKEAEVKLIGKALVDDEFHKSFMENPRATLEKESGQSLPGGLMVKVFEEESNTVTIILPRKPQEAKAAGELSGEALYEALEGIIEMSEFPKAMQEALKAHKEFEMNLAFKALEDDGFRQALLESPKELLEQETRKPFPPGLTIQVFEEELNTVTLVLPKKPPVALKEAFMNLIKRKEAEAKLIGKALVDGEFRKSFMENPKATLEKESGQSLPGGLTVNVVEEESNMVTIVLPRKPRGADAAGELSSEALYEALEGIAGISEFPEAMQEALQKRKAFEINLILKALEDDGFRQALLENPKEFLEQETRKPLPPGLTIQVFEEESNTVTLVLPKKPSEISEDEELSDEALGHVAGGTYGGLYGGLYGGYGGLGLYGGYSSYYGYYGGYYGGYGSGYTT